MAQGTQVQKQGGKLAYLVSLLHGQAEREEELAAEQREKQECLQEHFTEWFQQLVMEQQGGSRVAQREASADGRATGILGRGHICKVF